MGRGIPVALAVAALALALVPATAGADDPSARTSAFRVLTVPVPPAADLTVAHATFSVKPARGVRIRTLPRPRVKNAASIHPSVTVVGGLKKLARRNTLMASVVIVRRRGGPATAANAQVELRLPRGVAFGRFVRRQIAKGVMARSARPSYCRSLPLSFTYIAATPLRGPTLRLSGNTYGARTMAKFGSWLRCRSFSQQAAFLASFQTPGTGGSGGSGGGGDDDGGSELPAECQADPTRCDEDGNLRPTVSDTLTVTGTVTREGPSAFKYSITFSEAIHAYEFSVPGQLIKCPAPAFAAWYSSCPADSLRPEPVSTALSCEEHSQAEFTFQFRCDTPPAQRPNPAPTVPANTTITGRFTTQTDASGQASVRVKGIRGLTHSRSYTIPVTNP